MTRDHLESFARTLLSTNHVVVETTGNATAVTDTLASFVARVAVANPLQVHLIAKAKIKTDAIDERIQGGRMFLRRAIYMPALAAIRFIPDLKAKYHQLIAAGKHSLPSCESSSSWRMPSCVTGEGGPKFELEQHGYSVLS